MTFLSNIVFLDPWILSGLAGLPLLWWLLRVTPPAPRRMLLPTTSFLAGLIPDNHTTTHTPWWILLLRMLIIALTLLAFSHPVYKPAEALSGSSTLRLVIDNGWAAAQTWDMQKQAALDLLKEASRKNKNVILLPLAAPAGEIKTALQGPMSADQAESIIKGLEPLPWKADYTKAIDLIEKTKTSTETFWLSHGIDDGGFDMLAQKLSDQGSLTIFQPPPEKMPLLLSLSEDAKDNAFMMNIFSPASAMTGRPTSVQALDKNGQIVDQEQTSLKPGTFTALTFDTPESLRGSINHFKISGLQSAGSTYLIDNRYNKKSVGLIGPAGNVKPKPFVEARYYIRRAVEPFASIHEGNAEDILKQSPSVIFLPDIGSLSPETLGKIEQWVKEGGTLVRFAGPNMALDKNEQFLTPVTLLTGGERSLDGTLSWDTPKKLSPADDKSPLYAVTVGKNIVIKRQILAEPSETLESATWLKLDDGTPLITGAPLNRGLLVLIHTGIDLNWSDFHLSGTFVEILKRIVDISGHSKNISAYSQSLMEPVQVMNAFGTLKQPDSTVQTIAAKEFAEQQIDSHHPPGLYGQPGLETALNIGDRQRTLDSLPAALNKTMQATYGKSSEWALMPYLLFLALIMLLADWALMLLLRHGMKTFFRLATFGTLIICVLPHIALAADQDLTYADGLYLAYIRTGNSSLDTLTEKGLNNLAHVLQNRTSVEPDGVIGLDPEKDTLIFFPFIYWSVGASQKMPSEAAFINIQNYLDHGGTILFDTRDGSNEADTAASATENIKALTSRLSIPALRPISQDHVLLRAFYLLQNYPGRLTTGTLWAESQSVSGRDNVSSVLIGSNDWAGAWAEGLDENTFVGSTRQQETALRFGVNVMMYALTGNYKADQIHVKSILERLGE